MPEEHGTGRFHRLVQRLSPAANGTCWRPHPKRDDKEKKTRIPTHPIELAQRSVRRASRRNNDVDRELGPSAASQEPTPTASQSWRGDSRRRVRKETLESRLVHINDEEPPHNFVRNSIQTSKYNPFTFLPKFLFEMFSRVAYLYFLLQAGLSWWDVVSPFGGLGATMALSFVLLMSGVKAIVEDVKRHIEDDKINKSLTKIVNPLTGEIRSAKWRDLQVGDIIRVDDDELFPADILCLHTGLPDGVCFVRTTNLDGESNLKIRKPVDLRGFEQDIIDGSSTRWSFRSTAVLECELPNKNLHKFRGRFTVAHPDLGPKADRHITIPVTMSEVLLRGTLLKNSRYVYGLVVYTGSETRIQMNAAKVPLKMGSFDRFLNVQITVLIVAQIVLCILLAIANAWWREEEGFKRYFLGFDSFVQGNFDNVLLYVGLVFMTFWILTSYMVPISLFVTMEIVKFWQAFVFINNDPDMVAPDEPARARNSNLNEDLGKVEYIFSDKTGTLTSNDMQLRMISIKNQSYGSLDYRLEDTAEGHYGTETLHAFDMSLAESVIHLQKKDFWANLMAMGGSREFILSLPDSSPKLQRMQTMDRETLHKELAGFVFDSLPETVGELEVFDKDEATPTTAEQAESLRTPSAKLKIAGKDVGDVILGWHIVDFWMVICICHSLIIDVETDEFGNVNRNYQGPSPDEVALVEAARRLGFEFRERTMTEIVLWMQGLEVRFEILNVLEFTSERKRMSVVAQAPDGSIHLFCKGADNVMIPRLKVDSKSDVVRDTEESLHRYSVKGLRTLVLGSKILDQESYRLWDAEYQDMAGSLSTDRDAQLNRLAEKLERDFELVGLTAIEDKLQDGVPMAIETLRRASIKVWMITGDKMETAINIAISCNLVTHQDSLLIFTAEYRWDARDNLSHLRKMAEARLRAGLNVELVVDGPSLVHVLASSLEGELAYLGSLCSGVVICRSSPSQKAAVVRIMKEFELRKAEEGPGGPVLKFFRRQNRKIKAKMLAIGDGANDVTMIQAADVGVGIAGKEGRQAVNNSDYSIGQFKFLIRLLLVHGQMSHYRLARLIKFSFFKNISFAFVLIYYQFFCGFSGQTLIDDISAAMYNVVFTSMPILLFSILDRPVDDTILIRFPQLYNRSTSLSTETFWRTGVIQGMVDAAFCFFIPYFSASVRGDNSTHGLWSVGKTIYISMLGVVTLEVCLVARYWTGLFSFFVFLSFALVFPFCLAFPHAEQALGMFDPGQYGTAENLFATANFWLSISAVYVISFGYRYFMRSWKWLFDPDDNMTLAEFEQMKGPLADLTAEERLRLAALDIVEGPNSTLTATSINERSKSTQKRHNRPISAHLNREP
ncbi:hypothetical protein BSKO_00937 [Bryopsis sp. KO-2023]|nr:hypothetical protein BSKO_00937 [Bryopsis sp. KO-2023]